MPEPEQTEQPQPPEPLTVTVTESVPDAGNPSPIRPGKYAVHHCYHVESGWLHLKPLVADDKGKLSRATHYSRVRVSADDVKPLLDGGFLTHADKRQIEKAANAALDAGAS